jgi:hypothetical protein
MLRLLFAVLILVWRLAELDLVGFAEAVFGGWFQMISTQYFCLIIYIVFSSCLD